MLARADQALQILGRYKLRLDGVSGALSALEVEDLVTVRDVAEMIQRAEMVRRIADEIEGYVIELGADGRLVQLQLEELTGGVQDDLRLVCKDYVVLRTECEGRRGARRASPRSTTTISSTGARSRRCSTSRAKPTSTARSNRAATACSRRSRGFPTRSSSTSSTGSRTCRS